MKICPALWYTMKQFCSENKKNTNLSKLVKIKQFSYLHTSKHLNQLRKESYVIRKSYSKN